ncbi:MAG: ATP synthase F1 subunit gamma [Planctomycetota bacterium]|nr:ATP synthase F1 subunit gamma [Planctomycetota bacterium]
MANARALDKRRKSIRNIKKITRTMELIATARFKKAMDRASAATDYTKRITSLVADLAQAGLEVSHPLLESRDSNQSCTVLTISANRGLCGGYNGNVIRAAIGRREEMQQEFGSVRTEVVGKRGNSGFRFRGIEVDESFVDDEGVSVIEDDPEFATIDKIADRYLREFAAGELDRLDVAYTRFISSSRQEAVVETLLPLGELEGMDSEAEATDDSDSVSLYEFLPDARSILDEVVPTSFKVKLFKCFLDAAVSEHISRMVAMKNATENANEMIKDLSRTYNRARQSQITGEIMEVIGGVEALEG